MSAKLWLVLLAVTAGHLFADEVTLKALLNDPGRYQGRTVTTTGLAIESGSGFYLFDNVKAATKLDTKQAVYVGDREGQPIFSSKESHYWFNVRGTVNASRHGPWGDCPCEIVSARRQALRRETKRFGLKDVGYFRNATKRRIDVKEKSNGTVCILRPGQVGSIDDLKSGIITISDFSGKPYPKLFRTTITLPPRTFRADEPNERHFSFTIFENRLVMEK